MTLPLINILLTTWFDLGGMAMTAKLCRLLSTQFPLTAISGFNGSTLNFTIPRKLRVMIFPVKL